MNRRGFFASLLGREPETFFFGMQVVIATLSSDDTGNRLRRLLAEAARTNDAEKPQEKRALYKQIIAIVLENKPYWEYGYWDYLIEDNNTSTEDEFDSWVSEISASMATEGEELGAGVDEAHRLSADKGYIVVSMAFLLEYAPHESVRRLIEDMPEDEYWTVAGFTELCEALRRIDFEYALRDAVFIMPGNDDDGFSWEDLHGAGWEYLKPLSL
ncbi:MAG: hypothetical protein H9535_02965 [Ignavibacteria bacterium]|nr:hypothetical protein [Ignavibacteria bacterium]MBL7990706.1 hypothetical protein [Candidatus Kapabacteria bacterium]